MTCTLDFVNTGQNSLCMFVYVRYIVSYNSKLTNCIHVHVFTLPSVILYKCWWYCLWFWSMGEISLFAFCPGVHLHLCFERSPSLTYGCMSNEQASVISSDLWLLSFLSFWASRLCMMYLRVVPSYGNANILHNCILF